MKLHIPLDLSIIITSFLEFLRPVALSPPGKFMKAPREMFRNYILRYSPVFVSYSVVPAIYLIAEPPGDFKQKTKNNNIKIQYPCQNLDLQPIAKFLL
jgi:hypothetical protein